jgi:hypothetical protein
MPPGSTAAGRCHVEENLSAALSGRDMRLAFFQSRPGICHPGFGGRISFMRETGLKDDRSE